MTVEEFDAGEKDHRICRKCGHRGMVREHVDDNGGELVVCPVCRSRTPWGAALFLKQNLTRTNRKEYPRGESLNEVWVRYDNRCVVCSRTAEELALLHVGRNRQHVAEYAEAEHQGPIVPICARCHQIASALQRDAAIMRGFIQFSRTHESLSGRGPAVPPTRLPPDPLRAPGEAPLGLLERLSDDDALV